MVFSSLHPPNNLIPFSKSLFVFLFFFLLSAPLPSLFHWFYIVQSFIWPLARPATADETIIVELRTQTTKILMKTGFASASTSRGTITSSSKVVGRYEMLMQGKLILYYDCVYLHWIRTCTRLWRRVNRSERKRQWWIGYFVCRIQQSKALIWSNNLFHWAQQSSELKFMRSK